MDKLQDYLAFCHTKTSTCTATWEVAAKEYATDGDFAFNFKTISNWLQSNPRLKECQPVDVAAVYMAKHLFSIIRGVSLREDLTGRFTDVHNYLFYMEWQLEQEANEARLAASESHRAAHVDKTSTSAMRAEYDWACKPVQQRQSAQEKLDAVAEAFEHDACGPNGQAAAFCEGDN